MNKNKSSQSSGGGKRNSSGCTMKDFVKHRLLTDDDDFEKSLYKKPNPIPLCDKNCIVCGKISSPRATLFGEVKKKKLQLRLALRLLRLYQTQTMILFLVPSVRVLRSSNISMSVIILRL